MEILSFVRKSYFNCRCLFQLFLLFIVLSLTACNSGGGSSHSASNGSAQDTIEVSGITVTENKTLTIEKTALGREYLFEGNWAQQYVVAEFNAIKTRVVTFRQEGNSLLMLESSAGHSVDTTMGADLLLAEFPILEETEECIKFDFDEGMSRLFYVNGYWASDSWGEHYSSNFTSLSVSISFLDWVKLDESGRLSLRQIIRCDDCNDQFAVEYYLSEYQPSATYTPTPTPGFADSGYFEAEPLLQPGGDLITYASKFDISNGPITFAISANTPEIYRQAIRDGVNYWKHIMGDNFITVVDAPEGVTAPDPLYNVIQWVDYDTVNYAYSDWSLDPHTGEILHAQIFLPSAWTSNAYLNIFWTSLLTNEETDQRGSAANLPKVGLRGLSVDETECQIDLSSAFAEVTSSLLASGGTAAELAAAAQDVLTDVVAHEVGHTLGLRHNFCGSASAELQGLNPHKLFQEYRKEIDGNPDTEASPALFGNIAGSSIMDYPYPLDDPIIGHLIADGKILDHDAATMRYLYLNEEPTAWPLFGSDTVVNDMFLDCNRWDYGNPVQYSLGEFGYKLSNLPAAILEQFIATQAPRPGGDTQEINETVLYSKIYATMISSYRGKFLRPFAEGYYYLKEIKEAFPGISARGLESNIINGYVDEDWLLDVKTQRLETDISDYLDVESLTAERVATLLPAIDPLPQVAQWKVTFESLLAEHMLGTGPFGEYSFTTAEQAIMLDKADKLFDEMGVALIKYDVEYLSNETFNVVNGSLGEGLQQALGEIAATYLMAIKVPAETITVDTFVIDDEESSIYIDLPIFAYDWELRAGAIDLLSEQRSNVMFYDWGKQEREELISTYEEYYDSLLEPLLSALGVESFSDSEVEDAFEVVGGDANIWYREVVYLYGLVDSQ